MCCAYFTLIYFLHLVLDYFTTRGARKIKVVLNIPSNIHTFSQFHKIHPIDCILSAL